MTKYVFAVLAGLTLHARAFAATPENELENELAFLAAERYVVVTATKLEERIEKSVATTSVITREDIQELGARNLLDVLRLVPGLGITQSALGVREIEARGIKTLTSERVLFMLNGHPLDHNLQTATGSWVYDDLPVDSIKRVEVVRGPGSALYGANAFLAVINIITKNAKDLDGVEASAGWGSFDTQQYRASWGKQFNNGAEAAVHFNYANTNGIDSAIRHDALSLIGNPNTLAPGNSQLNEGRYDLEWQLGYQDFKFDGRFIKKNTGFFIGSNPEQAFLCGGFCEQNYENYFIQLSRNWKINEQFTIDTKIFYDHFNLHNQFRVNERLQPNQSNQLPPLFAREMLTDTRTGGEIQGNYKISDNQTVIAGFSYAVEQQYGWEASVGRTANRVDFPFIGNDRTRQRWGIYVQDVVDMLPNLRLMLGARYDEYDDFGGTFNPRLGFNWEFIKDYSLKFSYGTAYRAPAFGELDGAFSAGRVGGAGNAIPDYASNLKPEEIETFEVGIIARPITGLTTQAVYYYSHIDKMIIPNRVPSGGPLVNASRYINGDSMIVEGVELEGRYDFRGALQGSYTLANVVYQYPTHNGQRAPGTPETRANVLFNWAFDRQWSLLTHLFIKSETVRFEEDARPPVPAYALLNMNLLSRNLFGKGLDVNFAVYNLLDKNYVDPAPQTIPSDYPMAGRTYFGHINIKF